MSHIPKGDANYLWGHATQDGGVLRWRSIGQVKEEARPLAWKRPDHLRDLQQIFEKLRRCQLKMNPLKCTFGVASDKFLGFIVRHRGINIDQAKVKAIQDMPEPKNLKELRGLQGRLAYIRRFISNLVDRCHPFSHLMKKGAPFERDESCRNAFKSIKKICQAHRC